MPKPRKPSRQARRESALYLSSPSDGASELPSTPPLAPATELPLLLAARARSGAPRGVRESWVSWLAPHFIGNDSCYFTGTYSDDYGLKNGCMLVRNVHKDWRRFLKSVDLATRDNIVGVEQHEFRDVLHLHAIVAGPFTAEQREWLKAWWSAERGFARVLPVLDGCASYVTKYALKGDTDSFEWSLKQ